MIFPSINEITDFMMKYGVGTVGLIVVMLLFFFCLMYLFGVLCDRQPRHAKYIMMGVWIITFVQCILDFFNYPFYVGLIGCVHHIICFVNILNVPNIKVFSPTFYGILMTTFISQILILFVIFFGEFTLYQALFIVATHHMVSFILISSVQVEGKRVISQGMSGLFFLSFFSIYYLL